MNNLDNIKTLEKLLGVKPRKVSLKEIKSYASKVVKYAIDDNNNVRGITIVGYALKEVPHEISTFQHLTHLYLHDNQINDITAVGKLQKNHRFRFKK